MEHEVIVVNTGLPGFTLIEAIEEVDEAVISGSRRCFHDPPALGIECLAQLGAWHVRYLTDFHRHAFLAKINRCTLPKGAVLEGRYAFRGRLLARAATAFSYELTGMRGNKLEIAGNLLYAAVDYDESFRKDLLEEHYRRMFSWLRNVTGNGWQGGTKPDCSGPRP